MSFCLIQGDSKDVLKTFPENYFDSVVCDPPYGLSFMGRAWDYDVPQADLWREVLRVMRPGAHLLAFFGSRTYHRGVVQIEDAGFEIRDQIQWIYGSGFPKSLDVSKAIDKSAGAERTEHVGVKPGHKEFVNRTDSHAAGGKSDGWDRPWKTDTDAVARSHMAMAPATAAARQWQGWGTALKPAHEPIVVARKPLIGTVAENVLKHGTGAINIDGCRVEYEDTQDPATNPLYRKNGGYKPAGNDDSRSSNYSVKNGGDSSIANNLGRWPANLIHDGSEEVLAYFPEVTSGKPSGVKVGGQGNAFGKFEGGIPVTGFGDTGSAARFFYCAKASRQDRNEGLERFDKKSLHWSSGEQNPGSFQAPGTDRTSQNNWPTVKPTTLMRYLLRLVTPPGGVTLDPFTGSGSTGKAAMLEWFNFVGIELQPIDIAGQRIAWAGYEATKPERERRVEPQISLFE